MVLEGAAAAVPVALPLTAEARADVAERRYHRASLLQEIPSCEICTENYDEEFPQTDYMGYTFTKNPYPTDTAPKFRFEWLENLIQAAVAHIRNGDAGFNSVPTLVLPDSDSDQTSPNDGRENWGQVFLPGDILQIFGSRRMQVVRNIGPVQSNLNLGGTDAGQQMVHVIAENLHPKIIDAMTESLSAIFDIRPCVFSED